MINETDSPWKEILDGYLKAFLQLLFPDIHDQINWDITCESLDTELPQIVRDAQLGRRLADKLLRVTDHHGQGMVVVIHIEIQGDVDKDFARRMFTYHYRIIDRYGDPVVSLAVLGDANSKWRPRQYDYSHWGCQCEFQFPTVKLIDYRGRWDELETTHNPVATVVMAHLKMLETKHDPLERKYWKMRLVRRMYEQSFTKEEILDIFRIIDWLMVLPEELASEFDVELERYEKEHNMPYVTSIERHGIEKGLAQGLAKGREEGLAKGRTEGRTEGMQQSLLSILMHRFGPVPEHVESMIRKADERQLLVWIDRSLEAASLDNVFGH